MSTECLKEDTAKPDENETAKPNENENVKAEENDSVKTGENDTVKTEENDTVKTDENDTVKPEENNSVKPEENFTNKHEENGGEVKPENDKIAEEKKEKGVEAEGAKKFEHTIFSSSATNEEEEEVPAKKKKLEEYKCEECQFKCYNEAELKTHSSTSHSGKKRAKMCQTCSFSCSNVWEMDFHCRSRGHKAKEDDGVPCKKCDYMAENKDDLWVHKKQAHIDPAKLVECGDCVWVGDRLDNIRYHCAVNSHKMKEDYEARALAKAEAKGPKEAAAYKKKLAKDLKNAAKGCK